MKLSTSELIYHNGTASSNGCYNESEITQIIDNTNKNKLLSRIKQYCFKVEDCITQQAISQDTMPFIMICKLYLRSKNNEGVYEILNEGTGFLISKRVLITCAHNLFLNGNWYDDIIIVPNLKKQNNKCTYPLGGAISSTYSIPKFYYDDENEDGYDYGMIQLNTDCLYKKINSKFEFQISPKGNRTIHVAGYPSSLCSDKKSEFEYGTIEADINNILINHNLDSKPGQSGMPLWVENNGKHIVIGINSEDCGRPKIKITKEILTHFNHWINKS